MTEHTQPESPIAQLFSQSVVQGSVRYWAAHFAGNQQSAVQAALCFAHAMDMLTTANVEVIAEKSVWWHEELTDCTPSSARHPITKALLKQTSKAHRAHVDNVDNNLDSMAPIVDALHRHLHGALMSQQRVAIDSLEAWNQYAELRFGSLHEMVALASGMTAQKASSLGQWAARLHALGVLRTPQHYEDPRLLRPPQMLLGDNSSELANELLDITACQPKAMPANQIIISHELAWWKRPATHASPVSTGLPTGLRGMLTSWQAARKARSS